MMKRYSYVIALRGNTNAVSNESSNYRVSSGQVRASTMDEALEKVKTLEGVVIERNPLFRRPCFDYYREGNRVSVYVSPVVDDEI